MKLDDFLSTIDKNKNSSIEIDLTNIEDLDFNSIIRSLNQYKSDISKACVTLSSKKYIQNIEILKVIFAMTELKSLHIIAPKDAKWKESRNDTNSYYYGSLFEGLRSCSITDLTLENFQDLYTNKKDNFLLHCNNIENLSLISIMFPTKNAFELIYNDNTFKNIKTISIRTAENNQSLSLSFLELLQKTVAKKVTIFRIIINDDNFSINKKNQILYNEIVSTINARNPVITAKYLSKIATNIIEAQNTITILKNTIETTTTLNEVLTKEELKLEKLVKQFNAAKQEIERVNNVNSYIYLGDALQLIGNLKDALKAYDLIPKTHCDYILAAYKKLMLLNIIYIETFIEQKNKTESEPNRNISKNKKENEQTQDLFLDILYNLGINLIFDYNNKQDFYKISLDEVKEVATLCEEYLHKLYLNKNLGLNERGEFSNLIYNKDNKQFINNRAALNYYIRKIMLGEKVDLQNILDSYNHQQVVPDEYNTNLLTQYAKNVEEANSLLESTNGTNNKEISSCEKVEDKMQNPRLKPEIKNNTQ